MADTNLCDLFPFEGIINEKLIDDVTININRFKTYGNDLKVHLENHIKEVENSDNDIIIQSHDHLRFMFDFYRQLEDFQENDDH